MYSHPASIIHFKINSLLSGLMASRMKMLPATGSVFNINSLAHWPAPSILALPSIYNNYTLNVLTAGGIHIFKDTVVAYLILPT